MPDDRLDTLHRYEQMLRYELAIQDAEARLIPFAKFTSPDPKHPDDPSKTTFLDPRHLHVLADMMESIERGEIRKAMVSMPPRHGKTSLGTHKSAAWISGRNPDKEVLVATYGENFAKDFKKEVADLIQSQRFRQIFPEYHLVRNADDRLVNHLGKQIFFLGRRSPTTGRGGDWLLVDDPMKDDREVRSVVWRDDIWEWFTQTLLSRRHTDKAPVMVTMTRWHDDDIIGRITDKTNPKYSKEFADGWEVINLPALAEENDQMGRVTGEALWPSRFGVTYLEEMRAANPVAFSSLYQGDPTPQDGVFYQQSDLHTYDRGELPEGLRMHGASDHAVSTTTAADPSCLGIFGIDDAGTAWVLPDLVWRKLPADEAVEEMIRQMRTYRPLWWYAERGHISRAIGPFLKKRMQEEGVHTPIVEDQPVVDKLQRAHSARARCAQGRIRFPSYAAWWPRAKVELLKFPNGRHDDFVDFLSIIGMKLTTHVLGYRETTRKEPEPGTWGALKAQWTAEDHEKKARAARAGW